jgi:CRP-like cAMP-binding protein
MNFQIPTHPVTEWTAAQAARTLSAWRRLLPLGPLKRSGKDVVLFEQGDQPRQLFIIASGIVKLTCDSSSGQRSLLMLRYPGEFAEGCAYNLLRPAAA